MALWRERARASVLRSPDYAQSPTLSLLVVPYTSIAPPFSWCYRYEKPLPSVVQRTGAVSTAYLVHLVEVVPMAPPPAVRIHGSTHSGHHASL